MAKKTNKLRPVKCSYIIPSNAPNLYAMVTDVLTRWHGHLNSPHVLLFWQANWSTDKDGHTKLARISLSNDRLKELVEHDIIIDLNKELWNTLGNDKQIAVMDHEFCHVDILESEDGVPKQDERGRTCYRMRRHDLEEFNIVVKRHGCYMQDVQAFAVSVLKAQQEAASETPA